MLSSAYFIFIENLGNTISFQLLFSKYLKISEMYIFEN